jgi:hypothetical protein
MIIYLSKITQPGILRLQIYSLILCSRQSPQLYCTLVSFSFFLIYYFIYSFLHTLGVLYSYFLFNLAIFQNFAFGYLFCHVQSFAV